MKYVISEKEKMVLEKLSSDYDSTNVSCGKIGCSFCPIEPISTYDVCLDYPSAARHILLNIDRIEG